MNQGYLCEEGKFGNKRGDTEVKSLFEVVDFDLREIILSILGEIFKIWIKFLLFFHCLVGFRFTL